MNQTIIFSTLASKYIHASPAPYCLAAGVKTYAPELWERVQVVEGTVNEDINKVFERIAEKSPRFIGFSCYIWNIEKILSLCSLLKKAMPCTVIALGGPEVSPRPRDVLTKYPFVDLVFCGEGEENVPLFLRKLFESKASFLPVTETLLSIDGLCFRKNGGEIIIKAPCISGKTPPSPLIAGYAEALNGRIAYYESSRSCPYSCAYCLSGVSGDPVFFEGCHIFDDLLKLASSGTKTIKFVDRTFNANALHANRILSFILENYGKSIPEGITFHLEIGADILKEETMSLLEKMPVGAVQLEAGIQSFNEKTLEAVKRKTDLSRLSANLRRLIKARNAHVHIDLIAGLPKEGLKSFAESFNKAYALSADMLQLGFLKLIHGSAMREDPITYPCEFDKAPPYEVISTPALSKEELDLLHCTESALDRLYNSSRFDLTLKLVLVKFGKTPFEFFTQVGLSMKEHSLTHGSTLDAFTEFFCNFCLENTDIDKKELRDSLVKDRLASNNTGHIPDFLYYDDGRLKKALKIISKNYQYRERKGVRRGAALLMSTDELCFADYCPENYDPISGRYKLVTLPIIEKI